MWLVVVLLTALFPFAGGARRSVAVERPSSSRSQLPGAAVRVFPVPWLDLRRRIWWLGPRMDPWARRTLLLPPATATTAAEARWIGGARGALARVVHRQQLRRGAADGHGGVSHRAKFSLTAARRRPIVLVSGAGDVEALVACGSFSSTYCASVFLLCTLYVVSC